MIKKLFAVYDEKSRSFFPPFLAENEAVAGRLLEGPANNPSGGFLGMFPHDYSVYAVGEFNVSTGVVTALDHKEYCFRLADLIKKQPVSAAPVCADSEVKSASN